MSSKQKDKTPNTTEKSTFIGDFFKWMDDLFKQNTVAGIAVVILLLILWPLALILFIIFGIISLVQLAVN